MSGMHVGLWVVIAGAVVGVAIGGCGGKGRQSNLAPPPQQCPPGQTFNGQQCVPSGPAPTATPTATATTSAPPPPIPTAAPGPSATPLDATAAAVAVQLLDPLAKQHAPAGARKTTGGSLAGNFTQGQSLEVTIQMQPGICYTVVAAAPTAQNVDLQLAPVSPLPGMSPIVAQDQTAAATAVVGAKPNCFKWAAPIAAPMRVILSVSAGQGIAAAQVYEK